MRQQDDDSRSALRVVPGVEGGHDGLPGGRPGSRAAAPARRRLSTQDYIDGVRSGDRVRLGRAITLVESNASAHFAQAQEVVKALLPLAGRSVRLGVTGVPGAGKSTVIEALGTYLTGQGHKVAVTAVDPSSSLSGGSILGDKTRMERLSADPGAFIRPSPSGGVLGGVARKTRETMVLFEAAGYDVIIVETVGVGQSETTVRSMVDFFLLVLVPGAGDELQGIKKGVVELADAILINKADGANRAAAEVARGEYDRALHYLRPLTEGWQPHAYAASALTGEGILELWGVVEEHSRLCRASGALERRRRAQELEWMHTLLEQQLRERFFAQAAVQRLRPEVEAEVLAGRLPVTAAVRALLEASE